MAASEYSGHWKREGMTAQRELSTESASTTNAKSAARQRETQPDPFGVGRSALPLLDNVAYDPCPKRWRRGLACALPASLALLGALSFATASRDAQLAGEAGENVGVAPAKLSAQPSLGQLALTSRMQLIAADVLPAPAVLTGAASDLSPDADSDSDSASGPSRAERARQRREAAHARREARRERREAARQARLEARQQRIEARKARLAARAADADDADEDGAIEDRRAAARERRAEARQARRAAYEERRAAAKAKREAAAEARRERAEARREAYRERHAAALARREEAAEARRERAEARRAAYEERRAAAKERREAALAARREKMEERRAAAEARREEARERREQARMARNAPPESSAPSMSRATSAGRGFSGGRAPDYAPAGNAALLRVNSRPWSQVFVDGQLVGTTPLLGVQLPPGEHNIRLVNSTFAMGKVLKVKLRPGERVTRVEMLEE